MIHKVRVLIVSQYFWPESFQINEIARSLLENGEDVEILTGKPNYPEGDIYPGYRSWSCSSENWHNIQIHRIPILARGRKSNVRLALNYLSFIVSGILLAPWKLWGRKYDVIFVYAPSPVLQVVPALFLGWIKRCPVVLWVQDLWPESVHATGYIKSPFIISLIRNIVRLIYRFTDELLVPSRAFQSPIAALAPGKAITYHPNSVEPMFFDPPNIDLPDIPQLQEGFTVLFAGNVGAAQAVEVIVDAAELLKTFRDINFIILGNGSRWEWVKEQVDARSLRNLHLAGRYPVDTMPGLMRKASSLLVTLADEPTFAVTVPNKVQAYMAVGRPIVACLNGEGARLIEEAKAGLTVKAGDASALAEAILQLYRMSSEERHQLGENGRHYYLQNFSHERLVKQLSMHLRQLVAAFGEQQ